MELPTERFTLIRIHVPPVRRTDGCFVSYRNIYLCGLLFIALTFCVIMSMREASQLREQMDKKLEVYRRHFKRQATKSTEDDRVEELKLLIEPKELAVRLRTSLGRLRDQLVSSSTPNSTSTSREEAFSRFFFEIFQIEMDIDDLKRWKQLHDLKSNDTRKRCFVCNLIKKFADDFACNPFTFLYYLLLITPNLGWLLGCFTHITVRVFYDYFIAHDPLWKVIFVWGLQAILQLILYYYITFGF